MAGLDPAIHVFFNRNDRKTWIPGTRPGMDDERVLRVHYLDASKH